MPSLPRGRVLHAARIAFGVAVAIFIAAAIYSQWGALRAAAADARPRWSYIALSCAVVLATYALQIEGWRVLLRGWGGSLGFRQSARIWTVSNLGRYIPGKVWAIGSLAVMAQARGVSGAVAVGASIAMQLIYTVAGFVVLAATGAGILELPPIAVAAIVAVGAVVLAVPRFLPWFGALAGRVVGRDIAIPRMPHSAIWIAAAVSVAAWVLYGLAFQLLATGLLPVAHGSSTLYVAIYTSSYLAGFLALIAPGGVGVREVVMAGALKGAGFGTGEAILLVVASRVWLTILEILPAVLFLMVRQRRGETAERARDVAGGGAHSVMPR